MLRYNIMMFYVEQKAKPRVAGCAYYMCYRALRFREQVVCIYFFYSSKTIILYFFRACSTVLSSLCIVFSQTSGIKKCSRINLLTLLFALRMSALKKKFAVEKSFCVLLADEKKIGELGYLGV